MEEEKQMERERLEKYKHIDLKN